MAEQTKRRGRRGDGSVFFDQANGVYIGAMSLTGPNGKRIKRKVSGRTKTEAQRKLRQLRQELDRGIRSSATYTVEQCLNDWLKDGLGHVVPKTLTLYTGQCKVLTSLIGGKLLRDLTAGDVRKALNDMAPGNSTRTLYITKNCLTRAIRHAESNDLIGRNVASVVDVPKGGKSGRPSRSMTLDQAAAVLEAAKGTRLEAYVVISLLTGIRTEEARALRWDHVDIDAGTIAVWRSVRAGGDTKTGKSRRTLALPQRAAEALREHRKRQAEDRLKAGELWQDHGLVFASQLGTPLDANNVERAFRKITTAAGIGDSWVPKELRHTFVSIMSASGAPIESISHLVGHQRTATTELVYRHEIRPSLTQGAEIMDRIFSAGT